MCWKTDQLRFFHRNHSRRIFSRRVKCFLLVVEITYIKTVNNFLCKYEVLPFDLSPDQQGSTSSYVSPRQNGIVTLNIEFPQAQLLTGYTLFAYLMYNANVVVDGHKNVILDYIP